MELRVENEKREQFSQILRALATTHKPSEGEKARFFRDLEDLYHLPGAEDDFRHFYSDIFSVLVEIKTNDPNSGSLEYLLLNLDALRQGYTPNKNLDPSGEPIDIQSYIRKLYDHVNLEVQRIRYSDYEDYRISQDQSIHYLEQKVDAATAVIDRAQERIARAEKNSEDAKKEYVAILGIFASIVLAFTGGMVFSSSVLEHMHTVSIYRALIVSLVIGLVLFNVVYLLVWYINKIAKDESQVNWRL